MLFGEKDVRKLTVIVLVALLFILIFILIKPVILAILGGLILAYAFLPFYRVVNRYIKNPTLSASVVSIITVLGILALIWYLTPIIMQQVFQVFTAFQKVDVYSFLRSIFQTGNEQFISQLSDTITNLIGKGSSAALNTLLNIFRELPRILLNLFIVCFVFFFGLRDSEHLKTFFKGLSPFSESKEKILVKHFKDITDSVIYGQVVIGLVQGSLAGLGLLLFGVENALVLTLIAIFFSIIPFIGPAVVWFPVGIYLFSTGNTALAIGFFAYNIFFVAVIDNVLRTYLVARKTNISSALILVGMIAGLFVFGVLGLIIGPLLLAYLLTLLESFKDKSIYSLFAGQ